MRDGKVYLSLSLVQKYTDLDFYEYQEPARVVIRHEFTGVNVATVKKDTSIRYRGGIKSPVLTEVKKGDTLIYMQALEDWVQVSKPWMDTLDMYRKKFCQIWKPQILREILRKKIILTL